MLRLVLTGSGRRPSRRECLIVGTGTPDASASSPIRMRSPLALIRSADGTKRGAGVDFSAHRRSCAEGGGVGAGTRGCARILHRGDLLGRVAGLAQDLVGVLA